MRNSTLLKWTQNVSNKSGKENKNWIHPPETLQKGHIAYLVKFMGSMEVDQPKGFSVVREAIHKLRFNQQLRKSSEGTKLPKVELTISIDGITIQDPKTKTIMHQYPLYRISYCADDKVDRQFISFIVKEQDSEQHTCFVFLSDKLSEEITITIGQAFELAYKLSANKPNKPTFRARQLDVSKPMPIYMAEDLCDLAETCEIKRSVPQMPTGMEKDEECEHDLQRAIVTGTVIPTPEVTPVDDLTMYHKTYPGGYQMPKQLVRVHPFALEQEHAEYDADSEDEEWLSRNGKQLNVDLDKFEAIIDRLDKNSNYSVISLSEAKALVKENDDVVTAVYDYWLSKRLRLQHSLILTVRTEGGTGPANDPYVAFRRRKDKMQTRKNRKNDETSYEKMLKLKKDLNYAYTLFQMVQKRETVKLQLARLHADIYQKRFEARDFSGALLNEVKNLKQRPTSGTAPQLYTTLAQQLSAGTLSGWQQQTKRGPSETRRALTSSPGGSGGGGLKSYFGATLDESNGSPKEKRHYKKRKRNRLQNGYDTSLASSDDEKDDSPLASGASSLSDENPFSFKRQRNCAYLAPINDEIPWDYDVDEVFGDENRRYYAACVNAPTPKSVGFARRRLGRGGRIVLDRAGLTLDDVWSTLDYTIKDSGPPRPEFAKYKPRSPPTSTSSDDFGDDPFYESDDSMTSVKPLIEVENLMYPASERGCAIELELNTPLRNEATYSLLEKMATFAESRECENNARSEAAAGSILERWTKSRRRVTPVPYGVLPPKKSFDFVFDDGETVGCSTFRTAPEEYFDNTFNAKGGSLVEYGGNGFDLMDATTTVTATEKSDISSVSQLITDESSNIRELLLRKT